MSSSRTRNPTRYDDFATWFTTTLGGTGQALSTMTVPTSFALGCAEQLEEASRLHYLPTGLLDQAARLLPWSQSNKDSSLKSTVTDLYARQV